MKQIFQETTALVEQGVKFYINLNERTLKVGKCTIINKGKYTGSLGIDPTDTEDVLQCLDGYYQRYKHSVPSERSDHKRHTYFKALPEDKLSDEDMMWGLRREYAQCVLELYLLIAILNGSLIWPNEAHYFYQSKRDRDFIIMRDWIAA